ncbi:unnamed protein product [Protopolystoma xenopodis]|uniref:Uncharacterized protein n=1 Tax=Protopolystoma xenopodis TaxID=117903 RepID=A0A448WYN5_9PLAT|nr:unnamed protein product [Protopolystoma xenopodis]
MNFPHISLNSVDIPEPYFFNDCLYALLGDLDSARRFGLTVSTIHEANTLCKVCIDVIGVVYNSPFILDIDLDTFFTCNPFRDMYTAEQVSFITYAFGQN